MASCVLMLGVMRLDAGVLVHTSVISVESSLVPAVSFATLFGMIAVLMLSGGVILFACVAVGTLIVFIVLLYPSSTMTPSTSDRHRVCGIGSGVFSKLTSNNHHNITPTNSKSMQDLVAFFF